MGFLRGDRAPSSNVSRWVPRERKCRRSRLKGGLPIAFLSPLGVSKAPKKSITGQRRNVRRTLTATGSIAYARSDLSFIRAMLAQRKEDNMRKTGHRLLVTVASIMVVLQPFATCVFGQTSEPSSFYTF